MIRICYKEDKRTLSSRIINCREDNSLTSPLHLLQKRPFPLNAVIIVENITSEACYQLSILSKI